MYHRSNSRYRRWSPLGFVLLFISALFIATPAYSAGGVGHYYISRVSVGSIMQSPDVPPQFKEALRDPEYLNSFCNGAIAPDLECLVQKSHHDRTTRLFGNLLDDAEIAFQKVQDLPDSDPSKPGRIREAMKGLCFAIGWLSHCAADIAIHPNVNARSGDAYEFCDTGKKGVHTAAEIQLSRYLADTFKRPDWKIAFDIPYWLVSKSSGVSEQKLKASVEVMRMKLMAELYAMDKVTISMSDLRKEWQEVSQKSISDTLSFVSNPGLFKDYDLDYGPISTNDFKELRKECIGINDGKVPDHWGREYLNWWEIVRNLAPESRHAKLVELIKDRQQAPELGQNAFATASTPTGGLWELVDTVDYLNETNTYSDGAALIYSASGNSISHINRNNAKQEHIGSCSWSDPPFSIKPGEPFYMTLSANIDKLDPKRIGTFGPTISAYMDDSDIKYKFKNGAAIDLKSSTGETVVKTFGKDGTIVTGSASLSLGGAMPSGKDGSKIALMVSTSIGGGRKYVYEFSAAEVPVNPPVVQPPVVEPPVQVTPEPEPEPMTSKRLKLTGNVISMAFNPMRNMAISFNPSFGTELKSSTSSTGRYSYEIPILTDTGNTFTIDMTLTFNYMRTDSAGLADTYFNIRDESEGLWKDITVTTTFSFDLNTPEYKDKEIIEINRNVDFAYIPLGYITSAGAGIPDPLRSNLSNMTFIPGYTYVYDQISSGIYTAFEIFKEKEMLLDGFPLLVYVNAPGRRKGFYNEFQSQPQIHTSIEYSTYNDDTRYVMLHEFGHFFESMTNNWQSRCKWGSKIRDINYINHGGYLNSDSGDSFIEGFATWYAVMAQRYGLYPIRNYMSLAYAGTLSGKRKPWSDIDSEELCIAAILTYLDRDMTLKKLWPVLKEDRENFNAYYQALRATEYAQSNLEKFNRYFKVFGIYKHFNGDGVYNSWELYREKGNNGLRESDEIFADLMFDRTGRLNSDVNVSQVLNTLGQASDASRNRDALTAPASGTPGSTRYLRPNSYLKITGIKPTGDLRVAVLPEGQNANAYVTSSQDGLVYLSLPEEPATGLFEVTVPGGGVLWTERIEILQKIYNQTRGQSTWLAEAELTQAMLPGRAVITCPVEGDYTADPALYLESELINEALVFLTFGESSGMGEPTRYYEENEFVIDVIDEPFDSELEGGFEYEAASAASEKEASSKVILLGQ